MIRLLENNLVIESRTTRIVFSGIHLVSLQDPNTGEEFIDQAVALTVPGFQLLHQNGKSDNLGLHPLAARTHYHLLTDNIAEIVLEDWECDVSIRVRVDEESGDILLEPSTWTMQGGVAGLSMTLAGIRADLDLIAPFQQGFRGPLNHPQVQGKRQTWPDRWEAAIVSFSTGERGFSIQAWDEQYLFKAIEIGHPDCAQAVSLVTFAQGPLEQNRCTGNLCWRISAYQGAWETPFRRYRDWYWKAFHLDAAANLRPEWLDRIRLAVSWCPTDLNLLDSLAKKADPSTVYLHLPHWRPYTYDQDYPTYIPSAEGKAFIQKARAMGFHVAPHTNLCQMSPDHPLFFAARDFCTRWPGDMRWGGWSWLPVTGWANFGPPQSYSTMTAPFAKDWNVLVNVHLAWSPWRRHMTREIAALIRELGIDSIFVDVSHWIHNSDKTMLENLSYAQGSVKLARELVELAPRFCVCGEGRNEVTSPYISMVQFHLYNYAHSLFAAGEDVSWLPSVTLPVSEILFGGLVRGISYAYATGETRRLFIDAQLQQGTIPTLIFQSKDPVSELEQDESQYILSHMKPAGI